MQRTSYGEVLPLGNKPPGQRIVGFPTISSGAGKRQPAIPSVTGAPAGTSTLSRRANQALPGTSSRGLATNFGARGIAPFRPGSGRIAGSAGTKTSVQLLTMRRPTPFLETRMPASESPKMLGFDPTGVSDRSLQAKTGTVSKVANVRKRMSAAEIQRLMARAQKSTTPLALDG